MRITHPTLYKLYILYALWSISLGANFLKLTPTFMPFDMPKWPIGIAFLFFGLILLVLLWRAWRHHTLLRIMLVAVVALMAFWAGMSTYDYFDRNQTSLQLPIMYVGSAVAGFLLATFPSISVTAPIIVEALKNGNGNEK